MENPVFYVQMAHARIRSIERVAAERGVDRACRSPTSTSALLVHERELEVLRVAVRAARGGRRSRPRDRAPHKVTTWVRELAGAFHGFYHDCYVLGDGVAPELTQARLWLVEAARDRPRHRARPARRAARPESM